MTLHLVVEIYKGLNSVNLPEMFLGGMPKVQSGVWVQNMGWSRISSTYMSAGKLILIKCSQAWSE